MAVLDPDLANMERDALELARRVLDRRDIEARWLLAQMRNIEFATRQDYSHETARLEWLSQVIRNLEKIDLHSLPVSRHNDVFENIRDNIIWARG